MQPGEDRFCLAGGGLQGVMENTLLGKAKEKAKVGFEVMKQKIAETFDQERIDQQKEQWERMLVKLYFNFCEVPFCEVPLVHVAVLFLSNSSFSSSNSLLALRLSVLYIVNWCKDEVLLFRFLRARGDYFWELQDLLLYGIIIILEAANIKQRIFCSFIFLSLWSFIIFWFI